MKRLRLLPAPVALFAVLALCASSLGAKEVELSKISSAVAQLFSEGHYSQRPMDAEISERCLRAFFDKLDPDHLFFDSKDIEKLSNANATTFGKAAAEGKLQPAWEIYDLYKKRVQERRAKIEQLLATTEFDFKSDRFVQLSRTNSPWPENGEEADRLWRDQIEGDLLDGKLDGETHQESVQSIRDRYERMEHEVLVHSRDAVMADLLSALAHAYDPHSEYLRKQDFDALNTDMRLSMVGIGITVEADGRFVKISEVYPASPAGVDGRLKPNDRILAVAHGDQGFVKTEGLTFDQVMELIHSKKGTRIQLKVMAPGHPDQTRVVDLVSRTIELTDEQAKAEVIERKPASAASSETAPGADPSLHLGWMRIPSFYGDPQSPKGRSVARDVRALLKRLNSEHIQGLVLDLRGNPGGELDEAVRIGGMFLGKVPIVQERDGEGAIYVSKANSTAVYTGPLLVLIDHLTASAAELLAAALQDYGRAIIAGGSYSSFGKGSVQTVVELDELLAHLPKSDAFGAIQLTIAKFYRVNGASTQLKGLRPDLALPSPEDLPGEGETAMKNPLAYDEMPAVTGFKAGIASPAQIAELKKHSDERVKADQDFRYLLEDLDWEKANFNKVSLNEAFRRKEMEEDKTRTAARTAERLARGVEKDKVIELSLNAEKPRRPSASRRRTKGQSDSSTDPAPDPIRKEAVNILEEFAGPARQSVRQ